MLKEVLAGTLNPYFSSDATLTQGQLVKIDTANADKIVVAGVGEVVFGIVAQDVIAANINNFKLDSVTHQARVGDKVGIYIDGGVYITDQFVGNVTRGANLYAGANGQLVLTASGGVVAVAETAGNSATAGTKIRYKLAQL